MNPFKPHNSFVFKAAALILAVLLLSGCGDLKKRLDAAEAKLQSLEEQVESINAYIEQFDANQPEDVAAPDNVDQQRRENISSMFGRPRNAE